MRKKRGLLFVLILFSCMFSLSGCARFNTTFEVKKNGKVDVSMLYAIMDASGSSESGAEAPEDEMKELEEQGWECKPYIQDRYIGYECVKRNVSLKELSNTLTSAEGNMDFESNPISIERKGFTYIFDWKVYDEEQAEQFNTYKRFFDMYEGYMTFVIRLPYKPKDSNATSVSEDGKTLTWDLMKLGADNNIHVEFSVINIVIVVIILLCVIISAVLVAYFLFFRNNSKSNIPNHTISQGTSPVRIDEGLINPSVPIGYDDSEIRRENELMKSNDIIRSDQDSGFDSISLVEKRNNNVSGNTFCQRCGTELSSGALFCYNCGFSTVVNESKEIPIRNNEEKERIGENLADGGFTTAHNTVPIVQANKNTSTEFISISKKKVLIGAAVGVAVLCVFVISFIIVIGKMKSETKGFEAEPLDSLDADSTGKEDRDTAESVEKKILSRRPIPNKGYQTVILGDYCFRVPSYEKIYYRSSNNSESESDNTNYISCTISRDDYGNSVYFDVELIKNYTDKEDYIFHNHDVDLTEENLKVNNVDVYHWRESYYSYEKKYENDSYIVTCNDSQDLLRVRCSNDTGTDLVSRSAYEELSNSFEYIGGGDQGEGVYFVRIEKLLDKISGQNKREADSGEYLIYDLFGMDYESLEKQMTSFLDECSNIAEEYENSKYDESKEKKYNEMVRQFSDYMRKLRILNEADYFGGEYSQIWYDHVFRLNAMVITLKLDKDLCLDDY